MGFVFNCVRWRLAADPNSNLPGKSLTLCLEGIVLPAGQTLESLSAESRKIIASGSARSFLLWSCDVAWYAQSSICCLPTTPGLHVRDPQTAGSPTDVIVRWHIQWILEQTRRGDYTNGDDWDDYLAAPYHVKPSVWVPYSLVIPSTDNPKFSSPTGNLSEI